MLVIFLSYYNLKNKHFYVKKHCAAHFLTIPVIIGDREPKTTNSKMWQNGDNKRAYI